MGSAINVCAVPLGRLREIVGSRDRAVIDAVVEGQADFLQSIDDIDEETEMSCAEAVAERVNGEVSEGGPGYLYGYALEAICWHVGEELPNMGPISGASDWIEEVDGVLEGKGIPVRLSELVYGGSPVEIPEPDDYPGIGEWSAEQVAAARAAFAGAELGDLDEEMREMLGQIRG